MMLSANFLAASSLFLAVADLSTLSKVSLLKAIKSASSAWNFSQSVLAMSLSFVLPNPEHGLQENAIK